MAETAEQDVPSGTRKDCFSRGQTNSLSVHLHIRLRQRLFDGVVQPGGLVAVSGGALELGRDLAVL